MTAPMDAKLKECPFCGGDDIRTTPPCDEAGYDAFIRCNDCEFGSGQQLTVEDAITAWNTRTPPAAPSPEVDEALRKKLTGLVDIGTGSVICEFTIEAILLIVRPYLAPQAAVRVDLEKCVNEAAPLWGKKRTDIRTIVKAVILSLKQKNPDKEFIYE